MSTVTVDSASTLVAALRVAQDGDTILLQPGVYSGFSTKGLTLNFATPVTIASADPSSNAVLTDFSLTNVRGLTFSNLDFKVLNPEDALKSKTWAFQFASSHDLTFDHVSVHGSLNGDPTDDGYGISILNSDNIVITNSEFQQLGRALAVGSVDGIKVSNNYAHDLRSDGFDFAQVSHVEVTNNVLRNFFPAAGDHPDAIQFWTSGTKTASHDILISSNVIQKGEGEGTQGIFLRDQLGTLPFERVVISDNLILGTGYNAIRIQGAKDITIERNSLVSFDGDYKTFLLVQGGDGVVARDNQAIAIAFDDSIHVTQSGNSTTAFVSDSGYAAITEWLKAHPAQAATVSSLLSYQAPEAPVEPTPVPVDASMLGFGFSASFFSGLIL